MTMWVFAYGSLLWNPGFEAAEAHVATLKGYARSFCMHSIHYRGTQTDPGLVLALDATADAACEGLALAVAPGQDDEVLAMLRARELISSAYVEKNVDVTLADGRKVRAVTYVIDPEHVQYCGGLDLEDQARIIARAAGDMGPNADYLFNTVDHIAGLGLHDEQLVWLAARVKSLLA